MVLRKSCLQLAFKNCMNQSTTKHLFDSAIHGVNELLNKESRTQFLNNLNVFYKHVNQLNVLFTAKIAP